MDFETSRQVLLQFNRSWPQERFFHFRDLVISQAQAIIFCLTDADFERFLKCGRAEHLAPDLHALVQRHCAELQPAQLAGFSPAELATGLTFNLAYWFQDCARPGTTGGWRMPNGVIIGGAINDRIKEAKEMQRHADYWAALGPVTPPDVLVPRVPDPTARLHDCADLDPGTKVNVLRNYLDHRNSLGLEAGDGRLRHRFLKYHRRSLEAARRLFAVNPALTPGHLLQIMDFALVLLEAPMPRVHEQVSFRLVRKCADLSFLLMLLRPAATEMDLELPVERYLTKAELFGPRFDPSASPGANHPDRLALAVVRE